MHRFKEDHYTFPEKCFHNHEVNKNVTINESDEKQNDSKKSCIFSLTSAAILICIIIGNRSVSYFILSSDLKYTGVSL